MQQRWKYIYKYMNYVSIFVATVLEVPFLHKGVSQINTFVNIVYVILAKL